MRANSTTGTGQVLLGVGLGFLVVGLVLAITPVGWLGLAFAATPAVILLIIAAAVLAAGHRQERRARPGKLDVPDVDLPEAEPEPELPEAPDE